MEDNRGYGSDGGTESSADSTPEEVPGGELLRFNLGNLAMRSGDLEGARALQAQTFAMGRDVLFDCPLAPRR